MLENSVFEVTSTDPDDGNAGTAFAVDRLGSRVYVVTCAHVVRAIGEDRVMVGGSPARVEALGDPDGPDDIAVLSTELSRARPLRLALTSPVGDECTIVGFTSVDSRPRLSASRDWLAELTQMRSISGRLEDRTRLGRRGRPMVAAWWLSTSEDLTEGISGGPVIDRDSGDVVGVASLSFVGSGKAIAISIEALAQTWSAGWQRLSRPRSIRGLQFLPVPGGKFQMGTADRQAAALAQRGTAGDFLSEAPTEQVLTPSYYISRHVVTNSQYARFIEETGHQVPHAHDDMSHPFNWDIITRRPPENMDDYPVVLVSWYDAVDYCRWLGGRLPTEAEWEKAARGTDGREWPWGDEWDPARCNTVEGEGPRGLLPVGRFSPDGDSPYRVADMSGNVWEWCSSVMDPYPYRGDDGRESYSATDRRVIRGGAWGEGRFRCRCASRNATWPGDHGFTIGFRVVVPADSELLFQAEGP